MPLELGGSNDYNWVDPNTGSSSPAFYQPGMGPQGRFSSFQDDSYYQNYSTLDQLKATAGPDWSPKYTGDYGNQINVPGAGDWTRLSYQPGPSNLLSFTGDFLLPNAFFAAGSAGAGMTDPAGQDVGGYGGAGDVGRTPGSWMDPTSWTPGMSATAANIGGQLASGTNPIQSQIETLEAISNNPRLALTSFGIPAAFNADWSADTTPRRNQPMAFDDFTGGFSPEAGGGGIPQNFDALDADAAIQPDNAWMRPGGAVQPDNAWMSGGGGQDSAMMSLLGLDNGSGAIPSFDPGGEGMFTGQGATGPGFGVGEGVPGVDVWNGKRPQDIMSMLGLNKGSTWSTGLNTFSGLYGMYMANRARQDAQRARMASDPFAGERGIYQKQLRDLSNDPSSISKIPGYDAGIQAIQRGLAASGQLSARSKLSGGHLTALQKYGGDFYNQQMQRLMALSGGTQGAGYAGLNLQHGDQFATDMASKALATLGYTLRTA